MCGFVGLWGHDSIEQNLIRRMADKIQHRGPDDYGVWFDKAANFRFAHRRLSIVDLTDGGHQPMVSPCGQYVLVYNGEIYNHQILRKELDHEFGSFVWRSTSDTETLLVALRHWGVEKSLQKLNGMFAFALWDKSDRLLYLARDRIGEKPLYFGHIGNDFMFSSELKPMTLHPAWKGLIDRDSIASFMRYNHVPAPSTIYKNIKKLPPAHYIVIANQGAPVGNAICYWSLSNTAQNGLEHSRQLNLSSDVLIDELDVLLRDVVGDRMLADVPVGAFLSGGYDSTMIVAQMQVQSSFAVETFTIASEDSEFDEAVAARRVANFLGTNHTELCVSAKNAIDIIPKLPIIYDEPFADPSQIPTFLVSQLARSSVSVALSGDGGDELFGGYNRHAVGPDIWNKINYLPSKLRKIFVKSLFNILEKDQYKFLNRLPRRFRYPDLGLKLSKLLSASQAKSGIEFYDALRTHWYESDLVLDGSYLKPNTLLENVGLLEQMIFQDINSYLPDDILIKVDRASMAASLEVRSPFLDHRLVEFSWRVPSIFKVKDGKGKWLLRQVLARYVPKELMERRKQGFGVPISNWLRGPLRDWAECLLDDSQLRQDGYLNAGLVRNVWENHLAGIGHRQYDLWCVLMFQAWLRASKERSV